MKLSTSSLILCSVIVGSYSTISFGASQGFNNRIKLYSSGFGVTPNKALKDAAKKALEQEVGTFLTTKETLSQTTTITRKAEHEVRKLSTSITEYSQGAIRSIKIISLTPRDGGYNVDAVISIMTQPLATFAKELPSSTVGVPLGLFSSSLENYSNANNLKSILYNVLSPIYSGKVVKFMVGTPYLLANHSLYGTLRDTDMYQHFMQGGKENILVIPVTESIEHGFLINLINTLRKTATVGVKCEIRGGFVGTYGSPMACHPQVQFSNGTSLSSYKLFLERGTQSNNQITLSTGSPEYGNLGYAREYKWKLSRTEIDALHKVMNTPVKNLYISLLNSFGVLVRSYYINIFSSTSLPNGAVAIFPNISPWQMATSEGYIFSKRKYFILLHVKHNMQNKVSKIRISLGKI
jgi:hypothetical protein